MRVNVVFSKDDKKFDMSLDGGQKMDIRFDAKFVQTTVQNFDYYNGAYDVTPLITTQILQTKDKAMMDDVTVYMIPTKEILNDKGGTTFIVG